ncbi:hypothetical protein LDL59_14890 [Kaistella anthropi]|nr:hypothetical protein [Kaistella anthropi]
MELGFRSLVSADSYSEYVCTFVLLPLHALSDNEFPKLDEAGNLPYSWLRHQFEVTNDLTENNTFIRFVLEISITM